MIHLGLKFKARNVVEPCPSKVFQNHLRDYLESDSEAASKLIDTMLNQLNWAFSEFVRVLQEVECFNESYFMFGYFRYYFSCN